MWAIDHEPQIIKLRENETLPNVTLSAEQAAALRDHYKDDQLRVMRAFTGGGYDLTAGSHIGTIALTGPAGGLQIIIEPKVPVANLFYMLTYAHELPDFGRGTAPLETGEALFDLVVRIFVGQVNDIVRQGIHRGYVDFEERAPYLRGRLLLSEQIRRGPVSVDFHQRTNEFTADLSENRILRAVLAQLARVRFADAELGPRIRRTLRAFAEASPVAVRPADCDDIVYTRLNERYRSPINLARLFLRHMSLEGRSGETPFISFLVPMDTLFERFVARLLAQEPAMRPGYSVHSQKTIRLDEAHRLKGVIDIVLNRDGRSWLVLDTKYKVYGDRPKNDDIYQMVTYCHTLGVDRAILIYPSDDAPDERHRMRSGIWLETRPLSLAGSLAAFRERCGSFARGLAAELTLLP